MSEQGFDRIDRRLDGLENSVERIDRRLGVVDGRLERLETGQSETNRRLEDLGRHMRVLHEEAMAAIAATREYSGPTKAEFAELKDLLSQRIDPLEATVRIHSREIDGLKERMQ
jgi:predicted  nucleic acid-binding Zn-ribbon protein